MIFTLLYFTLLYFTLLYFVRQLSVATSVGDSRDSPVGIVAVLPAGRSAERIPVFVSSKTSRPALEPTHSSVQLVSGSFPGDKSGGARS